MTVGQPGADSVRWAEELATELLAPLGRRLAHTHGVAGRVASLRGVLAEEDVSLLACAAYLHDVGYSPVLVDTGLHSLDGARYLRDRGDVSHRVVNLVAHHSCADLEAAERGLVKELREFPMEQRPLVDALIYCDMTTGPGGDRVSPEQRIAEILERYGPPSIVGRFIRRASAELLGACQRVDCALAERRAVQPI